MTVIRVTDESSSAEIAETIARVLHELRRLPLGAAWQARGHERINALLEDWEVARMREEHIGVAQPEDN